jgi:predicted dehydrogenase
MGRGFMPENDGAWTDEVLPTSWDTDRTSLEPVRLGFIGAGAMASFAVYPALQLAPIRLVAVCDLDGAKARRTAERFGASRHYTDHREMLEKENLEAVAVQTHPNVRRPVVLDALDAGQHVFVPKPPAMSLRDTMELSEAATRHGRSLMVNFESRFSYGVQLARKIMRTGDFGSLTQLSGSFCSGRYTGAGNAHRGAPYENHLQAYLLDFASHYLDLARYLAGEVQRMALFHNDVDESVSFAVALEFESGAVGTLQLNSNRLWWRNYDRMELTGQGEYLILDGLWKLRHYTRSRNCFTENYRDERSGELTGDAGSWREFATAIRENREPVCNIHENVKTMELYQALYDAAMAGESGVVFSKKS